MSTASPAPFGDYYIPPPTPEEQALCVLEKELFELWGHITVAMYRFLQLVAEFDRREGWARHGVASCAVELAMRY